MAAQPRVLIVNDDPAQCEKLRKIIEGLCEVVAPESHQELVERLAEGRSAYPIVLLDYWFAFWDPETPPRNGMDVLTQLRPNFEDTPFVILLTNYEDPAIKEIERLYHIPVAKFSDSTPLEIYKAVEVLLHRLSGAYT